MEITSHVLLAISLLPFALTTAQSNGDGDNLATSIYGGGDSTTIPTGSSTATPYSPTATNDNNDNRDVGGLVNYYFVFLALFVLIACMGAFFMYRRKKKAMMMYRNGQSDALQQDVHLWDPTRARRRYWQGSRWRSADETDHASGRDEGLNENGEAPPPYMPKGGNDEEANHHRAEEGVAVPMQTLSREQAGLGKPPGYEEHYGAHTGATSSTASAGTQPSGGAPQYR